MRKRGPRPPPRSTPPARSTRRRHSASTHRPSAMPRFIVMSGLPASGKSALGRAIAQGLDLPHLDKDTFLEALFDDVPEAAYSLSLRSRLSREADTAFQQAALAADCAVLTSWWRHPEASTSSGTDSAWLTAVGVSLAEVHCVVSTDLAFARFQSRQRHAGHLDAVRDPAALRAQFDEAAARGPLFPGCAMQARTHAPLDPSELRRLAVAAAEAAGIPTNPP